MTSTTSPRDRNPIHIASGPHLDASDLRFVARLHQEIIPTGFLSSLGMDTLETIYGALVKSPTAILLVAKNEQGESCGFVCATIDGRRMYASVLVRHGVQIGRRLLPIAFSSSNLS